MMMTLSIRHRRWLQVVSTTYIAVFVIAACGTTTTQAFQMTMAQYKPPVKSSVKKLQDRRTTALGGGVDSRSRRSSKSAYAGALSVPRTEQSFEQRMRNLVVGPGAVTGQRAARRTAAATSRTATRRNLPANVHTIENLQDYKTIVADEQEKVVAVRFYASYCRVCTCLRVVL